jgi:hypothetical protein
MHMVTMKSYYLESRNFIATMYKGSGGALNNRKKHCVFIVVSVNDATHSSIALSSGTEKFPL